MYKGKVKSFFKDKGFGFIRSDDVIRDIFFHYSGINCEGYKILKEGDEVEFELGSGEKGDYATNITKIANEEK